MLNKFSFLMTFTVSGLLLLAGCVHIPESKTYSVAEVIQEQESLFGQRVLIRGIIEMCQPLTCALEGQDTTGRQRFLSIGIGGDFDRSFVILQRRSVLISAVVTDQCMSSPNPDVIVMCADRSNTLSQARLIRFLDHARLTRFVD